MSDLNVITVFGRCTRSAELSYTANGTALCKFSIANNESHKNQAGQYENKPNFFDCTLWGKYGQSMSQHLTKGRAITLTGRLVQDRWEKDGQSYSKVYIKVAEINLMPQTKNTSHNERSYDAEQVAPPEFTENIPF